MNNDIDLSIVVCTYNRDRFIKQCLEHCHNQSLSKSKYEVVLINNNSKDSTEEICLKFKSEHPDLNMNYVNETKQGLSSARNRGIKESKGKLISFIDDDAFPRKDYAKNLSEYMLAHPEVRGIGGRIYPVYDGYQEPNWMSKYMLTMVSALNKGDTPVNFKGTKFPIGANMAFKNDTFEKYGYFDLDLGRRGGNLEGGEEKEIAIRLKNDEQILMYLPNVEVDHIIPHKRVEMHYIRGIAEGIGLSEQRRLKKLPIIHTLNKIISELTKIAGTVVLFFLYTFGGSFSKGWMLIKFRYWITSGFFKTPPALKD